jgi:hypothetical protein
VIARSALLGAGLLLAAVSSARAQQTGAAAIPAGFGELKQDEVTMSLRSGPLLIKVTPLSEHVIRLLAPDRYRALNALARREPKDTTIVPRELFLVSFFSYEPNITFTPEDLQLSHQGKLMRATAIRQYTSGFGRQQLRQEEQQSAIYVFDERIAYELPIVVQYGMERSNDWSRILPKLEEERAKVRVRAGIPKSGSGVNR